MQDENIEEVLAAVVFQWTEKPDLHHPSFINVESQGQGYPTQNGVPETQRPRKETAMLFAPVRMVQALPLLL